LDISIKEILEKNETAKDNLIKLANVLNYIKLKRDDKYSVNLNIAIRYSRKDFELLQERLNSRYRINITHNFLHNYIEKGEMYPDFYSFHIDYELVFFNELAEFLLKPLNSMPLYINCTLWKGIVAKWRLDLGK
jgi:hypothetical protein